MEGPDAGSRQQEDSAAHQQLQQWARGVVERERLVEVRRQLYQRAGEAARRAIEADVLADGGGAMSNDAMTTAAAAAGLTRLRTDQVACLQTIRARASGDAQGAAEQLSLWILQEHLMA
eukprot:8240123-Lingulodinium_polyedra.AAC.1